MTPPRIAILPSHMKLGLRPGSIPLSDLVWPLGAPDGIEKQTLRHLKQADHLLVFPKDTIHTRIGFGTPAQVSLLVMEPSVIHGKHMRMLHQSYRRFHRVLTSNEDLMGAIPNAVFFAHGSTWVPEWRDLDLTKDKGCSLIASAKASQEGHRLRHEIVAWSNAEGMGLDVMGGGYQPFDAKSDGLARYRYSVVIENVRERNYFTEKLIDAVLCDTVPIYWGCPNIGDFIDTDGMILCENEDDIHTAVRAMSEHKYARLRPGLLAAKPQADDWGDYLKRAAVAVRDA